MKRVYTADDPLQAHAIRNFLEANGVSSVVVGDTLFYIRGSGAAVADDSLPQVWVTKDEDADRALALLEHPPALTFARNGLFIPEELPELAEKPADGRIVGLLLLGLALLLVLMVLLAWLL